MKPKIFLLTNDVETTSIVNHTLSDKTGELLLSQGMPALLELYAKYEIKTTFFFTGHIAKLYPQLLKMILPFGHEVGSHGLSHRPEYAFDILDLQQQIYHLSESKKILEDICSQKVVSFRAPAARVNKNTATALIETEFKIDSSISSQRLDMMFSHGALKKLHWLFTPRKPYFVKETNIFKKGSSPLLELPITALGFPYIGTFMRIAPGLNRINRTILHAESKMCGRPFVFLTHPNEFINEKRDKTTIEKRSKNLISYFIKDIIKHSLKTKNLGTKALPLLEKELIFFKKHNYNFLTCSEMYNFVKSNYASKRST